MGEQDNYERVGLDDSVEDERDLDQIMADRRAAEIELDAKEARVSQRKLPQLLHDQGPCISFSFTFTFTFSNFSLLFWPLITWDLNFGNILHNV